MKRKTVDVPIKDLSLVVGGKPKPLSDYLPPNVDPDVTVEVVPEEAPKGKQR